MERAKLEFFKKAEEHRFQRDLEEAQKDFAKQVETIKDSHAQ